VPFGDLVLYAASNLSVPLDGGSENTHLGLGLGTRFHIARDYYFPNYWEAPVTAPRPNDFTVQFALLRVF